MEYSSKGFHSSHQKILEPQSNSVEWKLETERVSATLLKRRRALLASDGGWMTHLTSMRERLLQILPGRGALNPALGDLVNGGVRGLQREIVSSLQQLQLREKEINARASLRELASRFASENEVTLLAIRVSV